MIYAFTVKGPPVECGCGVVLYDRDTAYITNAAVVCPDCADKELDAVLD